ncbi:hypothetical protein LYNGBM3L_54070 [Moorena producens 3L]|uniref:Uncharacterized protein n=1 Tax=Moorena producens 3L TaxID=489825 RepID=F4XQR8_9CYAN|nr:hypothetical protein LYNGBM3L_54070 [Moorena producens 3L]OLT64788.1 hypothetical protein BI334_06850 [Moorena producens 3L]
MLFWDDIGLCYKGLSFQKMKGRSIWVCILPKIFDLKALYSKFFKAHVTPSAFLLPAIIFLILWERQNKIIKLPQNQKSKFLFL